ncbi:serine protease [Vibrio sinensis]|uniref:Serine protease n=1 Tax=Vibrio sinensis TaxID=2302434 RepID=A0A3A6QPU7_9VIBR|nr:trypsin-like serine protease [Vibrio sinensis]RJX69686.1 serine protease [Vibrio sinensis]
MRGCITLLVLTATSCFSFASDVSSYIVNGQAATVSSFPSIASLFYRKGNTYDASSFCGATMLNSQYVLTAAHCLYGQRDVMLHTVVAPQLSDESQFLNQSQSRAAEFYYLNSFVDSNDALWPDDIAIIKLEEPLPVPDYMRLINDSLNDVYPFIGDYRIVGHGWLSSTDQGGSTLLQAPVTPISNATCRAVFGNQLTNKQICFDGPISGGLKNSTCNGDSGGPVYWFNGSEYIQIGVTSFGPSVCGDPTVNATSVFTELYDYQDWINNVLNGQVTPRFFVRNDNGERVLVENNTSSVSSSATSSSGGGSMSLSWLFYLLFLSFKFHAVNKVKNY